MSENLLNKIIDNYGSNPVGLGTISALTGDEPTTIEDFFEPRFSPIGPWHSKYEEWQNNKDESKAEYKEEYVNKVDEYIELCVDEDLNMNKQANKEKGYQIFNTKIKVNLPTIEGFARFIGVNKTSLYEWEKIHPRFSNALGLIRTEQRQRLIDNGLSGDYNPTIAKLILSANHGMVEKQGIDHTSGGKELPKPILYVHNDNSDKENNGDEAKNQSSSGGNIGE
jgi:hypothetical protein